MRLVGFSLLAALSGCQQIEAYRKPELAACQDFIVSTLRSPSSFTRIDYTVLDAPVDTDVIVQAIGVTKDQGAFYEQAKQVVDKPAIRSVLVNYEAKNAYGTPMRSAASCRFAMSDGQKIFTSPDEAADEAIRKNKMRILEGSVADEVPTSVDCCLSPKFDLALLNKPGRGSDVVLVDQGKN